MRLLLYLTILAFALGVVLSGSVGVMAADTSCAVCHNAMTGKTTLASGAEIELGIDMARFQESVHGFLACTECHMKFAENPHVAPSEAVPAEVRELADRIQAKAAVDPVAYSACSTCHPDIYAQVMDSVHGKNITEKGSSDGALCLDCHGSPHYILPRSSGESLVSRERVVETCGTCHANEDLHTKYELELNVMESYKESFHGKKHHLGHEGAPTCASCHGAHDIKAGDNPSSPVNGTVNKIEMCGGCHKGANAKFVVSYTHKPVGPIPHYAEKGLIILLISTIAFTIVHVILEAYSDVRDTVFRKGGSKDHGA